VGVLYSCIIKNLAKAVYGSNLPEEISRIAQEIDNGTEKCSEEEVIGRMDDRMVVLQQHTDGSGVLHIT
jgi:hypothetical protein